MQRNVIANWIASSVTPATLSRGSPSIQTWKRASRWQYRRGKAGSDSECDGWRPPVDSFTNLLAKQTARTHPVIIADGVSSARSRPYPIFIMPSQVPSLPFPISVSLLPSSFASCTISITGYASNAEPIFASPFRHIDFRALRVHVAPQLSMAPNVSVAACAIWICAWNGISGLYVAQIAFDFVCKRACG